MDLLEWLFGVETLKSTTYKIAKVGDRIARGDSYYKVIDITEEIVEAQSNAVVGGVIATTTYYYTLEWIGTIAEINAQNPQYFDEDLDDIPF